MRSENLWKQAVARNPDHAKHYAQRWRNFAAEGRDIYGEARLIDAMADRGSAILDAGCGTGRIAGYLAQCGHNTVGIDLDQHLIDIASQDYPNCRWIQGDLAQFEILTAEGSPQIFDLIVSAGNVMTFLADHERIPSLTNIATHMGPHSRFVAGFGLARGYSAADFIADAASAGLEEIQRYSTWQLHPANDDFLVSVLRLRPEA